MNKRLKIKIIASIAVIHLVLIVLFQQSPLNVYLFRLLNGANTLHLLWANITILGDGYLGALILIAIAFIDTRRFSEIFFFMIIAALITLVFKLGFNTPRPASVLEPGGINILGPVLTQHSFPSGHSTTFFMYLFVLWPRVRQWPGKVLLVLAAYLGAISRIMVGAHWPADILGGFLTAGLAWMLTQYFIEKKNITWTVPRFRIVTLILTVATAGAFFYSTGYPDTQLLQNMIVASLFGFSVYNIHKYFVRPA